MLELHYPMIQFLIIPNIQFWFKCLAFHVRIPSNGHTINSLEAYFRPCSYPIQIKSDHQCVLEQVRVAVWQKWREKYLLQVNNSKYFIEKKKQNFVFFVSFFFHFFPPHLQPWSAARVVFPTIPQSFVVFCFTMLGSQIDLYFWNRMRDHFASGRGAYNSLAWRNLCIITLLLLWPDLGQLSGYWATYLFCDWNENKKTNCLSSY